MDFKMKSEMTGLLHKLASGFILWMTGAVKTDTCRPKETTAMGEIGMTLLISLAYSDTPINTIGLSHDGLIGAQRLHGQHHLVPLHLASSPAYASSNLLPGYLQGWIPGPWLTATWIGFSPTRLRGLARPQLMSDLQDFSLTFDEIVATIKRITNKP